MEPLPLADAVFAALPAAIKADTDGAHVGTFTVQVGDGSSGPVRKYLVDLAEQTVCEAGANEADIVYSSPKVFADVFSQQLPFHVAFRQGQVTVVHHEQLMSLKRAFDRVRILYPLLTTQPGHPSADTSSPVATSSTSGSATIAAAGRQTRSEPTEPLGVLHRPPPSPSSAPAAEAGRAQADELVALLDRDVGGLQAKVTALQAELRSVQEENSAAGAAALERIGWVLLLVWSGGLLALAAAVGVLAARLTAAALLVMTLYFLAVPAAGLSRMVRAFFTAAVVLLGLRSLRARTAHLSDEESDAVWMTANRHYARYAYRAMFRLKGLWLKVGQYLSSRSDVVPKEYITELAKLQDSADSQPWSALSAMVAREWGCPVEEVLESVEDKALASASIAQVHRAKLRRPALVPQPFYDAQGQVVGWRTVSVQDVVVKVQHPGIDKVMAQDLWTLKVIVNVIKWAEPEYDFSVVLNEWSNEAGKELDFRREAALTRHAGHLLAVCGHACTVPLLVGLCDVTRVTVSTGGKEVAAPLLSSVSVHKRALASPFKILDTPYPDSPADKQHPALLATQHVLLAEYINGFKVTDSTAIERSGVDRGKVMADIVQAFALLMQVRGVFSGDPHPGNVLIQAQTHRPVLLDFGLTKVLTMRERVAFAMMSAAASTGSFDVLLDSFDVMGLKMSRENPEEDLSAITFALRDIAPKDEAKKRMTERRKYWVKKEEERQAAKLKRPVESFPAGLLFYFRAINLLQGLGAGLDARSPFMATLAAYSKAALRARSLQDAPISSTSGARQQSLCVPHLREAEACSWLKYAAEISLAVKKDPVMPVRVLPSPQPPLSDGPEAMLLRAIRSLIESGETIGAQIAVVQHGKLVLSVAHGELGPLDARPLTTSSLINAFSVTKGVTATLVHVLLQHVAETTGREIGYDTLVTDIWPEYASRVHVPDGASQRQRSLAASKSATTLRDVLTHRAGLAHALPAGITLPRLADLTYMIGAMEEAIPVTRPGSHQAYHYYSFGWLCAGVCRALVRMIDGETDPLPFSMQNALERFVLSKLPSACSDGMYIGLPSFLLSPGSSNAESSPDAPPLDNERLAKLCGSTMQRTEKESTTAATQPGAGSTGLDSTRIEAALHAMEESSQRGDDEMDDATADAQAMLQLLGTLKQRAYLMDPKLFNRQVVRAGEVPAANGHFTAEALATFYCHLGRPLAQAQGRHILSRMHAEDADGDSDVQSMALAEALLGGSSYDDWPPLIDEARLLAAVSPHSVHKEVAGRGAQEGAAAAIQRLFANDGTQGGTSTDSRQRLSFGLGYHLYRAQHEGSGAGQHDDDASEAIFGHSGLGGSVAFYCGPANAGVAVLVNQLSTTKVPTRRLLQVLQDRVQGLQGKLAVF